MFSDRTPDEHVAKAENLLALIEDEEDTGTLEHTLARISKAQVHMLIARYKKEFPPETGRPLRVSGRLHTHIATFFCGPSCPAFGTDSTNYPHPLPDNPQA